MSTRGQVIFGTVAVLAVLGITYLEMTYQHGRHEAKAVVVKIQEDSCSFRLLGGKIDKGHIHIRDQVVCDKTTCQEPTAVCQWLEEEQKVYLTIDSWSGLNGNLLSGLNYKTRYQIIEIAKNRSSQPLTTKRRTR